MLLFPIAREKIFIKLRCDLLQIWVNGSEKLIFNKKVHQNYDFHTPL